MKYSDAMQYIMDGVKEQEAAKNSAGNSLGTDVSGKENSMAGFEEEYAKLNQLAAETEVLEKKKKDFQAMLKQNKADFEDLIKQLAALQIAKDELQSIGWAKISSIITGKYGKKIDKIESDEMFANVQLNSVKMNIQMLEMEIKEHSKALARTKRAFTKQRKYMIETYGEDNRYEMEIEHKNVKVRAVIKEIDEACDAILQIMNQGDVAFNMAEDADFWGNAANFAGSVGGLVGFAACMAVGSVADDRAQKTHASIYTVNAMLPLVCKEIKDVIDVFVTYSSEFGDNDPYEDLNDESDLDHPMAFVRANYYSIRGRSIYTLEEVDVIFGRLQVIRKNLIKERTLISKELIK